LDIVLHGLRDDDIVVWQLDSLSDYKPFVDSLAAEASLRDRKLIYLRLTEQQ